MQFGVFREASALDDCDPRVIVCFPRIDHPSGDDPETAFNESDIPINVTAPVSPRNNFEVPTAQPVVTPRKQRVASVARP
jgi:hypothetical protein